MASVFSKTPSSVFVRSVTQQAVKQVIKNVVDAAKKSLSATRKKSDVGLSLLEIMKTTPSVFKKNSNNVVIKSLKETTTRTGRFPAIQAVARDVFKNPGRQGPSHKCSIIAKDGLKIYRSKKVHLDCDCEAFLYWCEYALNLKNAASIKRSDGEPPETRNPSNLPMMCKHLIELARQCKEHKL